VSSEVAPRAARLAWLPALIATTLAALSVLSALVPASCADPARAEAPPLVSVDEVPLDPSERPLTLDNFEGIETRVDRGQRCC